MQIAQIRFAQRRFLHLMSLLTSPTSSDPPSKEAKTTELDGYESYHPRIISERDKFDVGKFGSLPRTKYFLQF